LVDRTIVGNFVDLNGAGALVDPGTIVGVGCRGCDVITDDGTITGATVRGAIGTFVTDSGT
jgi:hypothetical protein